MIGALHRANPFTPRTRSDFLRGMMFRKAFGTLPALVACLLFAAPAFALDMIDPSTIQIVNSPDFRAWPVTAHFSDIVVQGGHVTFHVAGQNCDVTPQQCWPVVNAPKGPIQFTIWLFLKINGQWVGSGFIEGINSYNSQSNSFDTYARDWYYCCRWNPMTGHVIQEGETIGFMFGGGDQRDSVGPNSGVRSNIVTIQATLGTQTYTFAPPRKTTTMDFDGDGKADISVFRPSESRWFGLLSSTNYNSFATVGFGLPGDIPVPGDYDGDGKADIAVFRPSDGTWYIGYSSTRATAAFQWGGGGDVPEPGDYDGDGKIDLALYRPSTGQWFIALSSTGYTTSLAVSWGVSTDIPVPGDYDGDGKTDFAVFRPSTGIWYMLLSSFNYTISTTALWGVSTDIPVPNDYDGDGKTDFAVFRPSTGTWFILCSGTQYTTDIVVNWGVSTDLLLH
jgi:hypothetical protein